jgi:hypothetical protein
MAVECCGRMPSDLSTPTLTRTRMYIGIKKLHSMANVSTRSQPLLLTLLLPLLRPGKSSRYSGSMLSCLVLYLLNHTPVSRSFGCGVGVTVRHESGSGCKQGRPLYTQFYGYTVTFQNTVA